MTTLSCLRQPLPSLLLLALVGSFGHAQTTVYDFDAGVDTGLTRYNPLNNAVYSFPGGNTYQIQAPAPGTSEWGPARAGAYIENTTFTDFKVTVDLVDWDNNEQTHQAIGIFARGNDVGPATTNGYFFHYDPYGQIGGAALWIDRINGEYAEDGQILNLEPEERLDPTNDYRLEFTGIGDLLTGRVYNLDAPGTVLHEITWTDSVYTSGVVGLLVADQGLGFGNEWGNATFDNFSVTAVPEPSTTALLIGAASAALAMWVRRRQRSAGPSTP